MIFCFILIFVIIVLSIIIYIKNDNSMHKDSDLKKLFLIVIVSIILGFSIVFTVANREGKAQETIVTSLGYITYTNEELYNMSEKEKDESLKTITFSGIKYWRKSEQSTK